MKRISALRQSATGKKLLVFLAAFVIIAIPMQLVYQPLQARCDVKMMDFQIVYDADTVSYILNAIGEAGRSQYLLLLALDFCYGIIYAGLFFLAIALLLGKNGASPRWNGLLLLPAAAFAFDTVENLCTVIQLLRFPTIGTAVTLLESTGSCLKYLFLLLTFAAIAVLGIRAMLKKPALR